MSLKKYQSKRNFTASPEPIPIKKSSSKALHFCVQKHAARRLHYDFRLECNGVLVSWAVPKGPSLNPDDKRLAVKVEDHPLDYQYFEGVIPKGNYGAGKVEIWDHGIFTTPFAKTRKETEKYLSDGIKAGHFAVILQGERLNGEFIFQKLKKDPNDSAWLLIKKKDDFASQEVLISSTDKLPKGSYTEKMPAFITPMLPTAAKKPFNDKDWLFEIKWEGYRALAFINRGKIQLKSKTKEILNEQFPTIVQDLQEIKGQMILDGEIVVVDKIGNSHFELLEKYLDGGKGTVYFYVFDILYKNGKDLREVPLIDRKKLLETELKGLSLTTVRFSDHVVEKGIAFSQVAKKNGVKAIIGKEMTSTYRARKSKNWLLVLLT